MVRRTGDLQKGRGNKVFVFCPMCDRTDGAIADCKDRRPVSVQRIAFRLGLSLSVFSAKMFCQS